MAYTDAQLRFSNVQSLVGAAATTVGTNNVDLLSANRDIGRGQPMRLLVTIPTTFTGGTSVQAQYIQSANADMSSPDVLASSPVLADANATAGKVLWDTPLPDNVKRYVGIQYVTLGTHTAGAVSAHIVSDTDFQPYIPSVTGY